MVAVASLLFTFFSPMFSAPAQEPQSPQGIPVVELIPAPSVQFPAAVDSNSPAFWQFVQGQNRLHLVMSLGNPSISLGTSIRRLGAAQPVRYSNSGNGGRWMEAVVQDGNGTLYGYYHNEPVGLCGTLNKTAPRIGAARSLDNGLSWQDLGVILEVPPTTLDCGTPNDYFAGGVGDFSVVLNHEQTDAYFFFTSYRGNTSRQGIAVGRMLWAQRNTPQGNLALWDGGAWRYAPGGIGQIRNRFFEPRPIYAAAVSWHDRSENVDSFWGPSVHWNTSLNQYVMLMNRASDSAWTQEGIYISFSPVLDDPGQWTEPLKIIDGGAWYPQVMGLERDLGTDKLAGSIARLFIRGQSDKYLVFRRGGLRQDNPARSEGSPGIGPGAGFPVFRPAEQSPR